MMATRRIVISTLGLLALASFSVSLHAAEKLFHSIQHDTGLGQDPTIEPPFLVPASFATTASESSEDQSSQISDESLSREISPRRRKTLFNWTGGTNESSDEATAEIEPLATDRPDFTEASSTVGRGVFQIEAGYTHLQDRQDGVLVQDHSFGEPLLRYGVLDDWLELRLAVFPVSSHTSDAGTSFGVEDLYLGAKLALTEQAGWLPEMALTPQMTVPAGNSDFGSGQTHPGVNWLYGWDVTDRLTTAGSTQFNKAFEEGGHSYLEYAQSWTVSYSITDDLGAYSEWFALIPSGAHEVQVEHYFNGGLTYRFTDDIQWDVRAGLGLNSAAADFFTGTGLSVRFRSLQELARFPSL